MRPSCFLPCLLLVLSARASAGAVQAAVAAGGDLPAEAGAVRRHAAISCNATSLDASVPGEPPAWLLLAPAVIVLLAGRLARRR